MILSGIYNQAVARRFFIKIAPCETSNNFQTLSKKGAATIFKRVQKEM